MGFERFVALRNRFAATEPIVRISKRGVIALNRLVVAKFIKENVDTHVMLYYDKDKALVGIKPLDNGDEKGSLKLMQIKGGLSNHINSTQFCKLINRYEKGPFKYKPVWDEENEMIVIDLKDPMPDKVDKTSKTQVSV